jgi:hypothetical protein
MFGFEGTCERPQRDYECLSGIVMCLVEYPLCSSADELAVRSSVSKRLRETYARDRGAVPIYSLEFCF